MEDYEFVMDKVIFLDVDGVLNSNFWNDHHQREISDGTLIDKEKVALLAELVKSASAKIVLHSGWKYWFNEDLRPIREEAVGLIEMFQLEGIKIYDITPDFSTEEIRRTKKFSLVKAKEILGWLEKHPEISDWIVIDDLELHNHVIEQHQIRTDQTIGLTLQNIEQAKIMLNI